MSNYYLGRNPDESLGTSPRYWYALRKNSDGEIFLVKSDQLKDDQAYEINIPGPEEENFQDFEHGVDYYEGIDVNHNKVYDNLKYPQYRWDGRSMYYYIDDEGNLIQRLFASYIYPENISSDT